MKLSFLKTMIPAFMILSLSACTGGEDVKASAAGPPVELITRSEGTEILDINEDTLPAEPEELPSAVPLITEADLPDTENINETAETLVTDVEDTFEEEEPVPSATPTPLPDHSKMPEKIRDELAPAVITAASKGETEKTGLLMAQIFDIDPYWADKLQRILDYWKEVNKDSYIYLFPDVDRIRDDVIKNGMDTTAFWGREIFSSPLPSDDSLCFVIAGFELNNDGTPKTEMIDRLVLAIGCAQKYPNAYILLTGGPTAMGNSNATEADVMADWLIQHGVSKEKLIIENSSTMTFENAVFSYPIIRQDHPQINKLAIVSSDYHIPMCAVLFEAQCILNEDNDFHMEVCANVGCITSGYFFPMDEHKRQLIHILENMP